MSGTPTVHADEPHSDRLGERLNWLRAGVLGANDGIVSVAAVVVGVAAATPDLGAVFTAGMAALVGGAVSMALGEYVSVSSQRDSERALIEKEKRELAEMPAEELDELTALYQARGLTRETARRVAEELTAHDALAAHLEVELHIDQDELVNPWHAALSSAVSFTIGAILPMLAIMLTPQPARIAVTFAAVLVALICTGTVSAQLGGAPKPRAIVRLVVGGALALAATFLIGMLLGTAGVT